MSKPVIEIEGLRVSRSGRSVLSDLSFGVGENEIFALLGGNGAGKSTLLLTLLGFLPAAAGRARVGGYDPGRQTRELRRRVAYLPESAALYPHLSARDNLRYLLSLANSSVAPKAIEDALVRVGLPTGARSARLATYSKGMRQKAAIALAVLRRTPILLMDEPTSGLDPQAIDDFHAMLRELADDGRTILMVTHDVFGACQIADRIGVLRSGALVSTLARPERGQIASQAVHTAFKASLACA